MPKVAKVISGHFQPHYIESDVGSSRCGNEFVVTSGNIYCRKGKGHRHQPIGVDYDKETLSPDAQCSACGKKIELDTSTAARPAKDL